MSECNHKEGFCLPFPSSPLSHQFFLWKNKYFVIFCRNTISMKDSAFPSLLFLCHTSIFYEKNYYFVIFCRKAILKKASSFPSLLLLCNTSLPYEKIIFCHFLLECNFKEGFFLPFPSSPLSYQSIYMKNK